MRDTVQQPSDHPFDQATRVAVHDGRRTGQTSDDYRAFVGPFGGATAATILRALIEHPDSAGDPLAFTVNFCAPIAAGAFDLDLRLVKANRSTQHWSVELTQDDVGVAAFATAVFAQRRQTWSHQPAGLPDTTPFDSHAGLSGPLGGALDQPVRIPLHRWRAGFAAADRTPSRRARTARSGSPTRCRARST